MTTFVINVAAYYDHIKIEADDPKDAKQIAMMTIQDRWPDNIKAVIEEVI